MINETFETHDILNPLLWDNETMALRPEVRDRLLEIMNYFVDSVDIKLDVIDALVVGSNASYNYTAHSDIDFHLIVNSEILGIDNKDIVAFLYNNIKSDFNSAYDISIHGVPVEIYIEDVRTNVTSNGIYSVMFNRWIKRPIKLDSVPEVDVSKEFLEWAQAINTALEQGDPDQIKGLINRIYLIRRNSISAVGEYGRGNQLFKEVRNAGLLQKLKDAYKERMSAKLTLEGIQDNGEELTEESRNELFNKSRSSPEGIKRYKARLKQRVIATPQQFNDIDMNKLFTQNILTVDLDVQGEHDKYTVRVSFGGFLDILHDQIEKSPTKVADLRMITRALITGFSRGDVYIHCTCPDFKYRYAYFSTKNGYNSGAPENVPSDETNPHDELGSCCKHALCVLSNTSWLMKVASVINRYIKYMAQHQPKLYAEVIEPAVYGDINK